MTFQFPIAKQWWENPEMGMPAGCQQDVHNGPCLHHPDGNLLFMTLLAAAPQHCSNASATLANTAAAAAQKVSKRRVPRHVQYSAI